VLWFWILRSCHWRGRRVVWRARTPAVNGDGCFWCVGWVARLKSRREGRPFVSPKVSGYGLFFSFAGGSLLGPEIIQPTISPLTISLKSSIPLPQDPYAGGRPIPDGRRLGQSAVGRTARDRLERSEPSTSSSRCGSVLTSRCSVLEARPHPGTHRRPPRRLAALAAARRP